MRAHAGVWLGSVSVMAAVSLVFGLGACGSGSGTSGDGEDAGDDGGFGGDVATLCEPGVTTSVSGTVWSPAKSSPDPIYNAVVFVPAGTVEPFKKGVSCDRCGALEGTTAKVSVLTGSDGKFRLDNVPPGENVPLVVQIGRWRRQVKIPKVTPCVNNDLSAELTRLPRNSKEGDIPKTAIVTGRADPVECLLRKIGIDDEEFGPPLDPMKDPRIHIFKSLNGVDIGSGTISGQSLWKDLDWLKRFDQVLLPCEGNERLTDKPADQMQNVVDYVNAGGRVFTTHYGYVWLKSSPDATWKSAANWTSTSGFPASLTGNIDMSFPKGKAMAQWLQLVGATKTLGVLPISEPRIDATNANTPTQSWITTKAPDASVQHFTFNAPVGKPPEAQCGRVVYSNFHVIGSDDFSTIFFPNECVDGPLSPQERVIEFMLFDLASCVQKEDADPKPPR